MARTPKAEAKKVPKTLKAQKKRANRRSRKHPVLGVDLGATSVKIAHVVDQGDRYLLQTLDAVELDFKEDASSSEKRLAKVQALRTLLARNKIKARTCAVAVSGQAVAIRRIQMPVIADNRLGQIVRYDAEQQIPFPLKEVIWDYFKQDHREGEMLNVVLVAARKDLVREVTRIVLEAGLEPEIVTVNSLAAYSACRAMAKGQGAVAYVDVGARTTDVSIEMDGDLCFSRSIHYAMDRVTEEIQKAFDTSVSQAEKVKRLFASGQGSEKEREPLQTGLRRIVGEIQRTLNFFRTESGGIAAQRMIVTGGGVLHVELLDFLRERLEIPVDEGDPFVQAQLPKNLQGRIPHPGVASTVVGLALAGTGVRATLENLMPEELKAKKQIRFRMRYVAACVVVTGFNFTALGVLKNTSIRNVEYNVQQIQEYKARLEDHYERVGELDVAMGQLQARMGLMGSMNVVRGQVTDMMVEVTRLLTPDIQILSLNTDPNNPSRHLMTGLSGSTESLTALLDRMGRSPVLTDVSREGELTFTDRNEYTQTSSASLSTSGAGSGEVRRRLEERGVDTSRAIRTRGAPSGIDLEPRPAFKFTIAFGLR